MRTPHLAAAMSIFVIGVFGYALLGQGQHHATGAAGASAEVSAVPSATPSQAPVFDVRPLLRPRKNYLGVAIAGAPEDMSRIDAWAGRTGGKPNMITIYESFDDQFAAAEVRKIHEYGALPVLRWEPFKQGLGDIASGRFDDYLTEFATSVKRTNVPLAMTVAHEMNGRWYPWGAQKNKPAKFVAAWRHVHDVFQRVGATNVIWTWTPNVINYLPDTPLKSLWPGDAYVDWLGIDGYFTHKGSQAFASLFGPTIAEVTKLSAKPIVIVETGSEPGSMRAKAITDLLRSIATNKRIIGFVYFNEKGSANWMIDYDSPAQNAFQHSPYRNQFGFTVG
jgi:beta-mannanase